MKSTADVARILVGRPPKLINDLNAESETNPGISHYHRLSDKEKAELVGVKGGLRSYFAELQ